LFFVFLVFCLVVVRVPAVVEKAVVVIAAAHVVEFPIAKANKKSKRRFKSIKSSITNSKIDSTIDEMRHLFLLSSSRITPPNGGRLLDSLLFGRLID
jgi:hypothetical protein